MRSRTANWFICKIRYDKVMEDGLQKKVTETYVVDALSFSEAEARIMEEMSHYISGQFDVVEIDRCAFKEVFFMGIGERMVDGEANELLRAARRKDKKAGREIMDRKYDESFEKAASLDTRWYKSKVQFVTIDERSAKEKKTSVYYLVEGCSLESARNNIDTVFDKSMCDYIIASIAETNIMDVFEYSNK